MTERDPNIVKSSLSGVVREDGIIVEVFIYRLEHGAEWTLEVVNEKGTSIVWDDAFGSDDAAFAAFKATISEEGMSAFLDDATIIPFRR